jgi:hypothetical protein
MIKQVQQEIRKPIFGKVTGKVLGKVSEKGIYFWDKDLRAWELVTWEELLRMAMEPARS